jgi:hypothetical protein
MRRCYEFAELVSLEAGPDWKGWTDEDLDL